MSSIRSDFIFLSVSQYKMFIFALFFPRKKGRFFKNFQLGFFCDFEFRVCVNIVCNGTRVNKSTEFSIKKNAAREAHSVGAREPFSTASRNFQPLIIRSSPHNLFLNSNETFLVNVFFTFFLFNYGWSFRKIIKFSLYYH